VHLLPRLGQKPLDAITSEDVQLLKRSMAVNAPKNGQQRADRAQHVATKAVEWNVIDRMLRAIALLPIARAQARFHDNDQYERLVQAARRLDYVTYLIVLLGAETGLRCGEMIALEWSDVNAAARKLCIQPSDWNGQVTSTKGGRLRHVPMTVRLAGAGHDPTLHGSHPDCSRRCDSSVRDGRLWQHGPTAVGEDGTFLG
jgi:integrase